MDFFSLQDQSIRRSRLLFILFGIALVIVSSAMSLLVLYGLDFNFWYYVDPTAADVQQWGFLRRLYALLTQKVSLGVFCSTLLFFSVLSLIYEQIVKKQGGLGIAESIGGERLLPHTQDPKEKMLKNCVEEIAIASGMVMPQIVVLPHQNINAFAAGFSQEDAVIGVTRGALEKLTRDELQGVIAHEFSHILYGDMKLNARMMAILFSLEMITAFGSHGLRQMRYNSTTSRGNSRKGKDGAGQIVLIFIGMMIIGSLGYFLSLIIKQAMSRQREFLADAAAVQFTRNPDGIGGALLKIAQDQAPLESIGPNIEHMLFSQQASGFLASLMKTHPDIKLRLKRIFPNRPWQSLQDLQGTLQTSSPISKDPDPQNKRSSSFATLPLLAGAMLTESDSASQNRSPLHGEAEELYGAMTIILGLFVAEDSPSTRKIQFDFLREKLASDMFKYLLQKTLRELWELPYFERYLLMQISLNTMNTMAFAQKKDLVELVYALMLADQHIDIQEFALFKILRAKLRLERTLPPKKISDHHVVRNFLNFLARQMTDSEGFKKLAEDLMLNRQIDISLNQPISKPEDLYILLEMMEQLQPESRKVLINTLHYIVEQPYIIKPEKNLTAIQVILNAVHIPPTHSVTAEKS